MVCANEYDFLNLCSEILCPPTEDECTPGTLSIILTLSP